MRLVADRFAVEDDGRAMDLATGERVTLAITSAGDAIGQREWQLQCDERFRLRSGARAQLVDYGLIGVAQRFEAWTGAPPTVGSRAEHLHANSIAVGGGLSLIDRPAVVALSDLFRDVIESRPRIVVLRGPRGAGKTTSVLCLARSARTAGFVPIDVSGLERFEVLVADRTWFLIDRTMGKTPCSAWLAATMRNPRPHVSLVCSLEEMPALDCVALDRFTPDALIAAVRPPVPADRVPLRIRHAAERCRGIPGCFARALWPTPITYSIRRTAKLSRVAEQAAVYDVESVSDTAGPWLSWSAPSDLATLRQKVGAATALIVAGRHASGLRQLRQAVGGLARREAWRDAGRGALVVGSSLLRRGRVREAQRALEQAADHARRGRDDRLLIEAATLAGESWIDLARLDEAERVLSAALTSARAAGDRVCIASAAVSLARCLCWRGKYADAASLLEGEAARPPSGSTGDLDAATMLRRIRWMARIAVALGDTSRAMAALDEAQTLGKHETAARADAEWTSAFVRLVSGDLDGADHHAVSAIALAQEARRPLRRISALLIQVESGRRRGRPATPQVDALRRLAVALPPILKARWDLVATLPPGARAADAMIKRHAAATGLPALHLFVTPPRTNRTGDTAADPFVQELVDILRVCQTADDEAAVLKDVCARVREHLRAASVAFAAASGARIEIVAIDGSRSGGVEAETASRVVAAGIAIAPLQRDARIEAGAPIQYGGGVIGAICARWTVGTTHDLSRAPAVLAVAAAAAAPMLSAFEARRRRPTPPATSELLGVTPVVAALRESVDRAAAAPFAVLIEGESGVGKELVARAIHRGGLRRDRPFCTLNCAALPEDLIEAELFGHARGSFTGASADRAGVFEEAHGGTLFLDEVGELSARAQAKVLRVIQEGELRRIGENVSRRVDVRIVSATNRDLRREVEAGRFRLDLLYRLDVIRITVPPLRERKEDVAVLADHFWRDATSRMGSRATLAAATRAALAGYDWPGNVRELQNVLAALAARTPKRGIVPPTALPAHVVGVRRPENWRLDAARRTFEESFVRAALVRAGGHRTRAAEELGVTRQGLTKLMARLGITDSDAPQP